MNTAVTLTPEEKRVADGNAEKRLIDWLALCQQGNVIPAALIGFGSDTSPDDVTVITPPEYPLRFVQMLLQGALEKVREEIVNERLSDVQIVRA